MRNTLTISAFLVILFIAGAIIIAYVYHEPVAQDPNPPNATTTPNPVPVQTPTEEPQPEPDPVPTPSEWTEISWADRSKQQVVFTFDGGAGNHSIDEILTTLKKHGVRGTFFVTGKWAEQNPTAIIRMHADGHEIFNHTYSHTDLTTQTEAEIAEEFARTEAIIKGLTGKSTKPYFRPPYGARNASVLAAAKSAGYRSVYWTIDALDWKEGISDEAVRSRILDNVRPGTIYMMHIGDDITGRILDDVMTEIEQRGFSIRSLTETL